MKKVMVYAYTNYNLGDDLFIKLLCDRYPDTKFYLFAPKDYRTCLNDISNIEVFSSDLFFVRGINKIFKFLNVSNFFRNYVSKKCDAAVYIGGSLFMQDAEWRKKYVDKKSMLIENQPFYLLGANFGPYNDNEFYNIYKDVFKQYTDICFRDQYSYNLFKDLNNVRMADDIIFQLNKPEDNVESNLKNVVISVIKPSNKSHLSKFNEIYYKKMKDIAVQFVNKGFNVTLMSFCKNEGDEEAVNEIWNLIPTDYLSKVKKHFYKFNLEETLKIIASSSFVVASRFHSMILGWVYNKPVLPIVYSDKMLNVMNDVGFNALYTDIKNIHELNSDHVVDSMHTNLIDVSKQVKNAERHFENLDKYLSK